ncbi:MAG: hypothetical protein JWP49_2048 [Phenylobacterium sp.]|jgi:uncharacterized protein (DUF2236 family)|nr:hypothetical protein [Phenylobacterium sp.]
MPPLRDAIAGQVLRLVGRASGDTPFLESTADAGFFGPESASWRVHGDFTSMMIGGVAALLLQMLHPRALAGVWDHSDFRHDMTGRLRRTARFIAGTTYGSTDEALALIAHVQKIHDRVAGTLPDGTPYSANDPDLLTWIHVAEVSSFLAAYLRYRDPDFPVADQDRYFAETALVAERLGATGVPKSRAAVETYLAGVQPQLLYDHRTHEVARALLDHRAASPAVAPFMKLIFQAAQDLLPPWAAALHGVRVAPVSRPAVRTAARGLGRILRWALTGSVEMRARKRAAELGLKPAPPELSVHAQA